MTILKIAILVSSFPSISETFIVNQITDLIDRGHDIKIFSFQKSESVIVHEKIIDYKLIEKTIYFQEFYVSKATRFLPFLKFIKERHNSINFYKLLKNFNFIKNGFRVLNLRFFYKFKWILNEEGFDIFHAHFGGNGAYLAEMKMAGFFPNIKLVTSFHGYDLTPSFLPDYKIKYKKLFLEGDLFTVNTEYTKSLLRQITTKGNLEILPVGLDTLEFKPRKRSSDKFHLLFVGRLVPLKAPALTVQILRLLIEKGYKNIKLTIIGEGELLESLNKSIKKYKLEPFVKLTGALSQKSVKKIMQNTDVLIMPGIYDKNNRAENQGLVIQEAQAMQLPVIVSDAGGMKYGVIDGKTGFVVKEKDLDAFVEKIMYLIENPELGLKMGKAGRKFVKEFYDSKILGDQLQNLYLDLIKT